MKKKVYANEVTWLLSPKINAGEQANAMLHKLLGPELSDCFAAMSGGQYFVWELPGDGWQAMSELSGTDKDAADMALSAIGSEVRAKFKDTNLADTILELPSPREDYVFCRRLPDGTFQVMLAGWGCRSFARASSGHGNRVMKKPEKTPVGVRLSFVSEGDRVPGREFLFRFPYQARPGSAITGEDGYYVFPSPQMPGMKIEVTDIVTGRRFDLIVEDGDNDHVFDVTPEKTMSDDGSDTSSASDRNSISNPGLNSGSEPIPERPEPAPNPAPAPEPSAPNPEPAPIVQVKACVIRDGVPVAGVPVEITYQGNMTRLLTDEYGYVSRDCAYSAGQEVSASAGDKHRVQVISDGGNYFLFETFSPQPPQPQPPQEDFMVYVYDSSREPLKNTRVFMCQGDTMIPFDTDDRGAFAVGHDVFEIGADMTAEFDINGSEAVSVPFRFEENERIYHIIGQKVKNGRQRFLEILLVILAAGLLLWLWPWFVAAAGAIADVLLK